MKTIKIKSLSLINFKGIRQLNINDFGQVNHIFGDNATGKTTVFDAFTWLLFGKDSQDRTSFEIKTLDRFNQPIPKIEHEVSAILEINGELTEVKRILREKWVTKRGNSEAEFSGNETIFFWNDVPVTSKEFSAKVSTILDEKVFKMITNPLAFNSLKWQDRRQVLIDMVGGVTDQDIAVGNPDFQNLLSKLSNKTLEEFKKQVAASLKKMKAELKMIPTRIDEVERGKPEALDFDQLRTQIQDLQEQQGEVDTQMRDQSEADHALAMKKREIRNEISNLEDQIEAHKRTARSKAREANHSTDDQIKALEVKLQDAHEELKRAERTRDNLCDQKESKLQLIEKLNQRNKDLELEWKQENAKAFEMDESDCKCPTCKREFEASDIEAKREELETNFNNAKRQRLNDINLKGQNNTKDIKILQEEIEELEGRLNKGTEVIEDILAKKVNLKADLAKIQNEASKSQSVDEFYDTLIKANTEIPELESNVSTLNTKLESLKPADRSELESKKREIQNDILSLQNKLRNEETIKSADLRIDELKGEEKNLAQKIADDEKQQFIIESFTKAKIETLEKRINSKFSLVTFKMFAQQINGGETETCDTLINGVPFSDANNASKINAGIDIINTLSNYYEISAPIFIDNRESVVKLLPSESQIINLVVSEADKALRIETGVQERELQTA